MVESILLVMEVLMGGALTRLERILSALYKVQDLLLVVGEDIDEIYDK